MNAYDRLMEDYDRLKTQLRLSEQHASRMAKDFDASIAIVQANRDKCEEQWRKSNFAQVELRIKLDSALAACAAKDAQLTEGIQTIETLGTFYRHNSTWKTIEVDSVLQDMHAALSPNAGSDYVPKWPMVELQKALLHWQHVWRETDCEHDDCMPASDAADKALTAAAPYLTTDSTGEEKA